MKALRHPLLPAAVFAVCAITGWLVARTPATHAAGEDVAGSTKAAKTSRAPAKSGMPSEVLAMLAPVRAAKDTDERLRATIQLASNIPQADIGKWLSAGWFDGAEDMQASLFTRTLLSRWQEEDPAGMLEFCMRKEIRITYEFAQEWARRDPAAVLSSIEEEKDPRQRSMMLSYMGQELTKADPQMAASRIADLAENLGQESLYYVSGMIRVLASSSPDLLKGEMSKWPKALQEIAGNAMVSASLKKNFASAVADLGGQEDGKSLFVKAASNDGDLMKSVSKDPASLPAGWLQGLLASGSAAYYLVQDNPLKWLEPDMDFDALGIDANQSKNLRVYALAHLASSDREKLKSLISAGGLDDQERGNAISNLLSHLRKEEKETWIASLNDADRQIAQAHLASQGEYDEGAVTPSGLLSALGDEQRQISWAEARATGNWGREQMQALQAEFDRLPADQKAQVAGKFMTNSHSELPVEFTSKALTYLLANPSAAPKINEEEARVNPNQQSDPLVMAACNIATKWGIEEPVAAANWVKGLPAGDARTWAGRNLVVQWAEYDPTAARQWVASMPAAERKVMEQALQNRNAP